MQRTSSFRDLKILLPIAGLALVILGCCVWLMLWSVNRLVHDDARLTAHNWAANFAANLPDLEGIAAGNPASAETLSFIQKVTARSEVFRFKLFGPGGELLLVSDELSRDTGPGEGAAGGLDEHNETAAQVMSSGRVFVETKQGIPPLRPELYAELYLPVVKDGRTVAVAEVYVDQTHRQALFREHAFRSGITLGLMLLLAFGIPAAMLYVRTKQTEQKDAKLVEQNNWLNLVLENMSQGFCMFDADQRLILCNERYAEIYGLPLEGIRRGLTLRDILELRISNGNYPGGDPESFIAQRMAVVANAEEEWATHDLPNGRTLVVSHKPLPGGGWLTTHDDITEMRRAEERIAHIAHHDELTDLPNRALFKKRVGTAIPLAQRGNGFAVLCLDLDHFKGVNDSLGHPVGDELLKQAASRLRACMRESDTLARLGGDEFAIVQLPVRHPDEVSALAARISQILKQPFIIEGHELVLGTSIGITLAPADGSDPDQLLKNADIALNRAKTDGRGIYRFFESEMDERMKARRRLETDLRTAVQEKQFELYYQPIFCARNARLRGFEALIRWNHPAMGMIAPLEFVPLAEDIGLITQIGDWVVEQACQTAAGWPDDVRVAVNLSASQIAEGSLVDVVTAALAGSGLSPQRLELEITETVLLQDKEQTLKTLHQLRALGVRIAMDDFGTGYSSLSYLRSFPFDKIKIDGSFIKDLGGRENATAIISAVAALGRSLGMTTTAEGVETEEQLNRVRSAGYTEVQGYYYSPPRPAAEIEERYFATSTAKRAAVG